MKKLYISLLTLVLATLVAPANAQLVLTLYDGTNIDTVYDTDNDGILTRSSLFGSWKVNVTTALGAPTIGNPYNDVIDLNSINVSGGVGELQIFLTQTDLDRAPAPWMANIGGTTNGTVQFAAGYDAGNTVYDPRVSADPDILFYTDAMGSGAFSYSNSGGLPTLAGPYSLTMASWINHTGAKQTSSFDFEITIPEPATLVLMGIGLLGLALSAKRRKA